MERIEELALKRFATSKTVERYAIWEMWIRGCQGSGALSRSKDCCRRLGTENGLGQCDGLCFCHSTETIRVIVTLSRDPRIPYHMQRILSRLIDEKIRGERSSFQLIFGISEVGSRLHLHLVYRPKSPLPLPSRYASRTRLRASCGMKPADGLILPPFDMVARNLARHSLGFQKILPSVSAYIRELRNHQ